MSWGIHKDILYPTTPGRTIQQAVWDIMGREVEGPYKDPHKTLAAEAIREAVRTCAIPPKTLLRIKAFGNWYSAPPSLTDAYHAPFRFNIDVEEILLTDGN